MSWSTIAATEVLQEFTPQEQAALNAIQGASTQLAAILARAVNAARGHIIAGGNATGPDGTIPDQVRSDVIAIARWQWLISFPQLKALQTDARKAANDEAQKTLKEINRKEIKVEIPATPSGDAGPVSQIQVATTGQPRQATRNSMKGII